MIGKSGDPVIARDRVIGKSKPLNTEEQRKLKHGGNTEEAEGIRKTAGTPDIGGTACGGSLIQYVRL